MTSPREIAETIYVQGKWSGTNLNEKTWSVAWIESLLAEALDEAKEQGMYYGLGKESLKLIKDAVAAEREACLRIVEEGWHTTPLGTVEEIAEQIRRRGEG